MLVVTWLEASLGRGTSILTRLLFAPTPFLSHTFSNVLPSGHPEKVMVEWNNPTANDIPHSVDAVTANYWEAAFFAAEARKNGRGFPDSTSENKVLIYNYAPDFAVIDGESTMFEQLYFFPAASVKHT